MQTPQLNELAALAAEYVNTTHRHIFLTGKAGTGKTTFLQYIVDHTYKNTVVAAPTGIAAINAGGVTLHSLLQLPFGTFIPENVPLADSHLPVNTPRTLGRQRRFRADKRQMIQEMELLIIDEVSMLRADLLDCIDLVLRSLRGRSREPFGGVQLLLIGDLMQLPPVVKEEERPLLSRYYSSPYFFAARALQQAPPLSVELQKIYRQSDQDFIDILNRLRHNEQTEADLARLNQHHRPGPSPQGYIHLTTHNYKANRINEDQLQRLPGEPQLFEAQTEGDFPDQLFPTSYSLALKVGAQVMFIKNDPSGEGKFFNGKLAEVSRLKADEVWVKFEDGTEVAADTYEWENKRFKLDQGSNQIEEITLGRFVQYPLKLAWAVTVHKSQGLTFEKATIDVSDTFAPGQLYVALSRLTSLAGLRLSSPLPTRPPAIDVALRDFVDGFADQSELSERLQSDRRGFLRQFATQAFHFEPLVTRLQAHLRTFDKQENRSLKQQHRPWTEQLLAEVQAWDNTGKGFIKQVQRLLEEGADLERLAQRAAKAQGYFEPQFAQLIDRVQAHRGELAQQKQVKAYREEVEAIEAALIHQVRQVMKFGLLLRELAQGRVPTKQMLAQWERQQPFHQQRGGKVKKTPSAEITLRHFREGKSPAQIAELRELSLGTVMGHLIPYVARGEVEVTQLLDPAKLEPILAAVPPGQAKRLSEIKAELGEDYTYDEIRLAIAHVKQEQQAKAEAEKE